MANVANLGSGGLKPLRFGDIRGLMASRCDGQHDVYVAEVLYVPAEGKLVVVTVCRACTSVNFHEKQVAEPHHEGELLKQGK